MRNLKKILALVLALVMSLSLMATAGAADFSDKDQISDKYSDAVTVLNGLEVFKGYDNGARFEPQGDITRAEVAAIIYRIATGDVSDTQKDIYSTWGLFTDVADGSWYAGYVNYCANAGYIKGRGNKIFDPNGKVTGYEALAMILRAIGYDKNNEFSGSNWQVNTASIAKQRGITNNITDTLLGQAATREVVAEILFQAILVPTVTFNTATISYTNNATSLGKDVLNLDKVTGVVVANEYANVQDDDLKVLAEGKTQLRVAAGDVRTLDLGTDLNDIGMSENAYIQGSKVLLISEADNTVFDNTDINGENVDLSSASKFSDKTGMSKNDSTEFFVNFDHSTKHEANRRIEIRVRFENRGAENEFDLYATDISKVAAENGYTLRFVSTNTNRNSDGISDFAEIYNDSNYPVEYVKVFRVDEEVKDNDLKVIKGIFGMADNLEGTTWQVSGSVYVGTSSQNGDTVLWTTSNDKSDTMSFKAFKEEYIDTDLVKNWEKSDDGEWVKVIDNNGDGVAEYAFLTTFTLDKAVNTYTKNDESTLRYYALDLVNGDYTGRYMNTVAEGDIVLHTTIDDQALIWKAEVAEDEITKINDIYSRKVTATTKGGTTYSQSEIENASRLDQRIDQMDETVNYRMYLDAFGRIRAYEPVDGNRYALVTEMYYGNLRNGRYVVDDVLTAELKAGDAALTERVVNNPVNNDFILNFRENGSTVRATWSRLNTFMNNESGKAKPSAYDFYIKDLYEDKAEQGFNFSRPSETWADFVVLQPAKSGLGFETSGRSALDIFENATTNIARYVVNADGTVNLSTAAQRNYKDNGTLVDISKNGYYAVDYVELSNANVSSKQNTYNGKTYAGFSTRVDANNETEYYIVSNSGVEHFVGYSNLPAISNIRAMYSVARNTSTDYTKNNYWVAEVIVIEADNYSAQPDDYVFVIGRADMVNNGSLANRQAVGSQYLYAISAKNGVVRIAPTNLSWGVGTYGVGFYKAYGVSQMENGTVAIDRLESVDPYKVTTYGDKSYNTSSFQLKAGTVNRYVNLNDRIGVTMAGVSGISAERQITLKGGAYAIIQDERGYVTVSTRLDGDNWTNQVLLNRDILWVEDSSSNALFIIDVTHSENQSKYNSSYGDGIAKNLRAIWTGVKYAQGNSVGEGYTVTVQGTYGNGETDGLVYLKQFNDSILNAEKGTSFWVAKNNSGFVFKPEAGYGFKLDKDGDKNVTIVPEDAAKLVKSDDGWYQITDIKENFTIKVPVAKDESNKTVDVYVQSNDSSVSFTGTATIGGNEISANSYVTLVASGVTAKKEINVASVRVGHKILTEGVDYTVTGLKINFKKAIAEADMGDIFVMMNVTKITNVELMVYAPMVPGKNSENARNSRLANGYVPLFFVNGRTYTESADGKWAIFNLGTQAVGSKLNLTFQVNPEVATLNGSTVLVGIPGTSVYVELKLTAGYINSTVYEVQGNTKTEIIEVISGSNVEIDLDPTVVIGATTVEGSSLDVYNIVKDTNATSVRVRVSGVDEKANISVYTISGDTTSTPVTGIGTVDTDVNIEALIGSNAAESITLQVEVSYLDKTPVVKTITLTYSGNASAEPEQPEGGGNA